MYAYVNGIKLYYEKLGSGTPLIMLHGNTQSHRFFKKTAAALSDYYTVYTIDSRAHGKSTRVLKLDYSDMTNDIALFIKTVVREKVAVYGLSDGGIIALMLAFTYPELVSRIVASGASTCPHGSKDSAIGLFKFARIFFPVKMKLLLTQPNITAEQLSRITVPTIITAGSNDMIKEENTRFIASSIPQSRLIIFDGESHTSYAKKIDIIKDLLCLQV